MDRSLNNAVKIEPLTKKEIAGESPIIRKITVSDRLEETVFQDYMTTPSILGQYHLVSDGLKQLFSLYLPHMEWMPVALIDQHDQGYLYWFLQPEPVDCLSPATLFGLDRTVKHLILKKSKLPNSSIFQVSTDIQKIMVVRLDVAESIMRRSFLGLILKRIALEEA